MNCVEIRGGKPLCGRVKLQGSKNGVLPILAGCVLHEGVTRIRHCPRIRDVFDTIRILESLGCSVWWEEDCLAVDAKHITSWKIPEDPAVGMRSPVLFLGALLGRMGRAQIPYPGGCVLGPRPVDLHLQAMTRLGVEIREKEGGIEAEAKRLQGGEIHLRFPSVGATENSILAAVLAEGNTRITGCAREPEVLELCAFLRELGARIRIPSEGVLEIEGVERLKDGCHELSADRIVAGTYLLAAAVTEGSIEIEGAPAQELEAFLYVLEQMGVELSYKKETLFADCTGGCRNIPYLETAPYPGFPTDLQSPIMTLMAVSRGSCCLRERIFESRFKIAEPLIRMGADIRITGGQALIRGVPKLLPASVEAGELRGAAALFLAGLNACGVTRIRGCGFADRGYENFCDNLIGLGADIKICQ